MKRKRTKHQKKRIIIGILVIVLLLCSLLVWFTPSWRAFVEDSKNMAVTWVYITGDRLVKFCGFSVQNIQVTGLKYTSKIDVLKVLNIDYGDNIFAVDTENLLEELKKIGWIEHVSIQKKIPSTIDISIQEYKPYALWQHKNIVSVITETGVVIPKANPKHFPDLPLVVGEKANLQCKGLFSILLDYTGFKDMVVSAQYMYGRRWRLYFSTNVIVDLPEENIGDTIHKIYMLHQKQKILDRDVEIIDTRVPNKLVFKGSKIIRRTKKLTQQGV